ncbi:hypothetical protein PMSD_25875 [Paenibacillus macquariensis subsp. defensor]|nr:hypothetical protein PMSD_25875 [Paenibacillus macquariensis subsp. defensor]
MSNTPNLGLLKKNPITDGNDTFNIETMLNGNWDKLDGAVGQIRDDIQNIDVDIPDASLTVKGITKLNSAVNSVSETEASTPKAVKSVNDSVIAHKADNAKHVPHLGTTTNIGNAYSVTTTETIAANQKFTVKVNAASTGAATLNVSSIGSAKAIKKPGGTDATLKVGVYTFFWDGTSFQLLGEGGETLTGDAIAANVLASKTFYKDNPETKLTGTMVNRGSIGTQNLTLQNQEYTVEQGYHDGTGKVKATYIAKGKTALGNTMATLGGDITVTGLDFTPRIIRIRSASSSFPKPITVMHRGVQDFSGISHDIFGTLDPSGTTGYGGDSTVNSRYTITSDGFTATIRTNNIPVYWEAEE